MSDDSNSSSSPNLIDEIADSFVSRLRNGERPSIKEYATRYPEHADELRELLPTLAALEDLHPAQESVPSSNHSAKIPEQIGEYRILREIGRGGMGIVFEAEHRTMRRRVALKVLPASNLPSSHAVQRFHREARAAGQLHHTNIVPVFEVGKADGFFFYAMQFIHGQNLDVVIDEVRKLEREKKRDSDTSHAETIIATQRFSDVSQSVAKTLIQGSRTNQYSDAHLPEYASDENSTAQETTNNNNHSSSSWHLTNERPDGISSSGWTTIGDRNETYFQRVARVGLQVAQALEYAHKHGVLHRDIKPSNLLLDTEGVVWITDFGLAKDSGDELTHTGDVVGTLRYMAPERFKGSADARSDIYSLGLTLYELCTLQHAFQNSDRAQLVKQVTTHQPPRPRRVRSETPRDMETIILKAIDRDPTRRYSSAAQFAQDLNRFVSDKPISARRASFPERAWRWCRRNPFPAWLAACIAFLLITVAVVSLRFAYVTGKHAKDLESANLGGRAHLYHAYVGKAQAQRWSRRQGQNASSREMLQQASELMATLNLRPEIIEKREHLLRNEYVAANCLFDLEETHRWEAASGWTARSAFDLDYTQYAQADLQGNIQIRTTKENRLLMSLPTPGHQCWSLAFSPDKKFLAATYHHPFYPNRAEIHVWNLEIQERVLEFPQGTNGEFRFTRSGLLAIAFNTRELKLYSLEDLELLRILNFGFIPEHWYFDRADQNLVVTGPDLKTIEFWKLDEEPQRTDVLQVEHAISYFDWNEKQNQIAIATSDHQIRVWDLDESRETPIVLGGHRGRIVQLKIHESGNIVMSYSWDGTTRVFDFRSETEVLQVEGIYPTTEHLFTFDSRISFSSKRAFGIWQLPADIPIYAMRMPTSEVPLDNVEFHPRYEQLILVPTSSGLVIRDFVNDVEIRSGNGPVRSCRVSPDGDFVLTASSRGLERWPLDCVEGSDEQVHVELGEPELLLDGDFKDMDAHFPSGMAVAIFKRGYAKIIPLDDPQAAIDCGPHTRLAKVSISPDGNYVLSSTWQGVGVHVWDTTTGQLVKSLLDNVSTCVVGSHESQNELLVATGDEHYRVDLKTLEVSEPKERAQPDGWAADIDYSSSGQLYGCAYSRYRAQIIDTRTNRSLAILESPILHTVGDISFSPSDRYVCISGGDFVTVWDLWSLRQNLRSADLDWDDQEVIPEDSASLEFVFGSDASQ